jgi:hypothetical protein
MCCFVWTCLCRKKRKNELSRAPRLLPGLKQHIWASVGYSQVDNDRTTESTPSKRTRTGLFLSSPSSSRPDPIAGRWRFLRKCHYPSDVGRLSATAGRLLSGRVSAGVASCPAYPPCRRRQEQRRQRCGSAIVRNHSSCRRSEVNHQPQNLQRDQFTVIRTK